ncbi:unnamed protein product [Candidula unifasciata]|uniref:Immunoglobulin V-set domain-containing protein n=1 Tax=Candidula unifasciata TaxID=100452 RepID=A0A8S3YGA7_9EUPU|nr:unnamed protein product [Candidula unifasciata]
MWRHPARLIPCLLLLVFANSQGLSFFMNSTSNGASCGQLHCVAQINQTVYYPLLSLSIYNDTDYQDTVTLASVSQLDPHVQLGHNLSDLFNATGQVLENGDGVLIDLRLELNCYNGSFICELALLNTTGQYDVISRAILP